MTSKQIENALLEIGQTASDNGLTLQHLCEQVARLCEHCGVEYISPACGVTALDLSCLSIPGAPALERSFCCSGS